MLLFLTISESVRRKVLVSALCGSQYFGKLLLMSYRSTGISRSYRFPSDTCLGLKFRFGVC